MKYWIDYWKEFLEIRLICILAAQIVEKSRNWDTIIPKNSEPLQEILKFQFSLSWPDFYVTLIVGTSCKLKD